MSAPRVSLIIRPPRTPSPAPDGNWIQRCVGMYREDDARLDAMVARCKRAGWTSCSASLLIRLAIYRLDLRQLIAEAIRGELIP